jgi:hypothetical protein
MPMTPARRRRTLVGLAVLLVVLFLAGVAIGYVSRKNSICPDNKPPVAQEDPGLGQIFFRCADGQTITGND